MKIQINGKDIRFYEKPLAFFAVASASEAGEKKLDVVITPDEEWDSVTVRPLSLGIKPEGSKEIRFSAEVPCKISVEPSGKAQIKPIFLFLYDYAPKHIPAENEIYFPAGEHFPKRIVLESNQTLYVDEGAVVHTKIYAEKAENIRIAGRGILDSEKIEYEGKPIFEGIPGGRSNLFSECKNVLIEDVTTVGSHGTWNIVLAKCNGVKIKDINIMTWLMCGDGIDVCGCEHVEICGCFIHTNDDCIVVKALAHNNSFDGCANGYDIHAHDCILWNQHCGNAMEIGFETRCEEISNVTFEDITVIHAEHEGFQSGGVITIHNGDRAHIHDILYKNITVEDANEKLFDMKILRSKYSKDEQRGSIDNIKVQDLNIIGGAFPPSIIMGYWEGPIMVHSIDFENVNYKGKRATNQMELRLVAEMTQNINIH